MKVDDPIALGTLAGVIATIPQLIIDYILFKLGFAQYFAFHLSASIFLSAKVSKSIEGLILGGAIWILIAGGLGVFTVYVLKFTGNDYWWLKGVISSNVLMYIGLFGFFYSLGGANIIPEDFGTNASIFVSNIVFGLVSGYLVVKWRVKIDN